MSERAAQGEPGLSAARPLVLGSGSPRRREILTALGVPFVVHLASIDEAVLPGEEVAAYLPRVALAKLEAVCRSLPAPLRARAAAILVADTSVVLDEAILGKPASVAEAEDMIARLQGRAHEVHTRFALGASSGEVLHAETVVTRVTFRPLARAQVRAYAESGEGLDKAGAYAVQGLGSGLVSRVEGSYTSVVGLPACEVAVALERAGLRDA